MSVTRLEAPVTRLLTATEVAEQLRCSPKTVRRLSIPCVPVGRRRMYRPADVEAWITRQVERVA